MKNQPLHVISRAVEERNIFDKEDDCFRYIFQAYATNIGKPGRNLWRQDMIKVAQAILNGEEISSKFIVKEHPPLVHFLDFSLVVTHCHFYLVPNIDDGASILMKNMNNGFAKYFNLKYNRKGTLFASRYKRIIIKNQFQSDAVSRYINTINPLDVFQPRWREEGLKDPKEGFKFLENYSFSSFPDKIGKRNSTILAPPEILEKYITIRPKNTDIYKEFTEQFLKERSIVQNKFFLE